MVANGHWGRSRVEFGLNLLMRARAKTQVRTFLLDKVSHL